ncbi:MAG: Maf family protein [Planctomycetia bacterium]|jgi:septum formation protein
MNAASPRSIILASQSPRRLELARSAGWDVRVTPPPEHAEANAPALAPGESLPDYVMRLALAKARAVGESGVQGTILACDTLGEIDGMILGKPRDRDDARRMLAALSGRTHRVVTGVCLWQRPQRPPVLAHEESLLDMGLLDDGFLDWYLDSDMWRGKAGACGFQDDRLPLRLVSGSPSNVVGLPLETVARLLADLDSAGTLSPSPG